MTKRIKAAKKTILKAKQNKRNNYFNIWHLLNPLTLNALIAQECHFLNVAR